MDQTSLVNDVEIEAKVVSALSRAQIPVTAVDWNSAAPLEKPQLIVVTPLVDTRGPRDTYARIFEALSNAGVYQSTPIRNLFVKSPADPDAKDLIAELKRMSEGSIHITRDNTRNGAPKYSLVLAPYVGSGGAIPSNRFAGNDQLRVFLEKRLGIDPSGVAQALSELSQKGSATIVNVQLSLRRAKKLKLAA
jgi:hypothetical protein